MKLMPLIPAIACIAVLAPPLSVHAETPNNEEAGRTPGHAGMRTCLPVRPEDATKNNNAWAVNFSFLVDVGGEIREAKLTSSSGDKALDRDALKAFQKCNFLSGHVPGPSADILDSGPLQMEAINRKWTI
jgi:TonB family protein